MRLRRFVCLSWPDISINFCSELRELRLIISRGRGAVWDVHLSAVLMSLTVWRPKTVWGAWNCVRA